VYEASNSSYRSRWFCTLKKDGHSLRLVHGLEPLNAVTIRHSGVTPIPEHIAEQFAGRACGAVLDLYVGYNKRLIKESSHDYTTFQTPFSALRLVTLPMGWTNSVPIFHDDVCHILQPEIPDYTVPYIDDIPIKGPATRYLQSDGTCKTIPKNPGIRRFVWEHFQNVNHIVQRMKYCGGTFSGWKSPLCIEDFYIIGHYCTPDGHKPDNTKVAVIQNWGPCNSLSEVRAFLGTICLMRIYICNYAHRINALNKLTHKDIPFEFGPAQIAAQEEIKRAVLECPALKPIDYHSDAPVILAVDTSLIAVGFCLCQKDLTDPKKWTYNCFGSITLNDRECRFLQPKLEIYGLYRTLRALRLYIIGVRNLVVKTDARYIKGMLSNPDIQPSTSINHWLVSILMFHFTLVHVKGIVHGPDGLSQQPRRSRR
jgi:RNase H-like domain found in reverse transcriptase